MADAATPAPVAVLGVTWPERICAGLLALCCLAVLVIAACLSPSPSGHGTHEQLGLPACGWAVVTGYPCPTCGMTTAFAHMAQGHWWAGLKAQPFGALLALAAATLLWGSLHVAVFGSRLGRVAAKLLQARWIWTTAALWALSWGYKILTWQNG